MDQREIKLDLDKAKEHLAQLPDSDVKQIIVQANNWADYHKYTGVMNGIMQEMKEIPILPSERANPDDTNALRKVEFPEDGGVLTWMENFVNPYKGYPHYEFVDKIDVIKKLNRALLSGLYHRLKNKPRWLLVTLVPATWLLPVLVRAWLGVFHRMVERFRIKPIRYSTAIRELHRSMSVAVPGEKDESLRVMIRDLLCMVAEFDNAYRFRLQDVLCDMDKVALEKNPRKELIRLLGILRDREKVQEIKDTWTLLVAAIRWYSLVDREFLRVLQHSLLGVDLALIQLDASDKEFCIPRKDYSFGFMQNPSPKDSPMIQKGLARAQMLEGLKTARDQSTAEHERLSARHRQQPDDPQRKEKERLELDAKWNQRLEQIQKQYRQLTSSNL